MIDQNEIEDQQQEFQQILAQTLQCQSLKMNRKYSKKISEFQYYKQIINENNQIIYQIPEGDNCLYRAVSTSLYFTPQFSHIVKNRCLNFVKNRELIIDNQLQLPQQILTLIDNQPLKAEFCKNPSHYSFEKINLQLISLAFDVRIILYTIQDGYLCSTIFNNNFDNTIELLKTTDNIKNNNQYNVIFSQQRFENMSISQKIILDILEEKFDIFLPQNNMYKNFVYDNWYFEQEKMMFDQEAFDQEQQQLQQLSSHEKQLLRKHKKSLSDNFNLNFEDNKNDNQEFEMNIQIDNSNELPSKNMYFNNNAALQDAYLSDSNISSLKVSRGGSQEKIQLPSSPSNNLNNQNKNNNINNNLMQIQQNQKVENQFENEEGNEMINDKQRDMNVDEEEYERMETIAEGIGSGGGGGLIQQGQQNFATPQKPNKFQSNENTSNQDTQTSIEPNQGSAIQQLLNQPQSPTLMNSQIRSNQNFKPMPNQNQNLNLNPLQIQKPFNNSTTYIQPKPMINPNISQNQYQIPYQSYQQQQQQQITQVGSGLNYQQNKQQSPGLYQGPNNYMNKVENLNYSPSRMPNNIQQQLQKPLQQLNQSQQKQQPSSQPQQIQHVITDNKRYQGKLKFFDEGKSFGFIIMDEDNSDIFVHQDDLLQANVQLEFLKTAKQGNLIRFEFNCLSYMGKYKLSRKAVNLSILENP